MLAVYREAATRSLFGPGSAEVVVVSDATVAHAVYDAEDYQSVLGSRSGAILHGSSVLSTSGGAGGAVLRRSAVRRVLRLGADGCGGGDG